MALVDFLIKEEWLKNPKIIEAFKKINRKDFLPSARIFNESGKELAELNEPLPIGSSQTISQPSVVAFMLEKLNPKEGDKILDIGSGSGYTSVLLSYIVGEKGKVISLEIIPELKEFGENNVKKYNFLDKGITEFFCLDGSLGYKKEAPYDKILSSASGENIPKEWKSQLKIGGRIVAPVKKSIWVLDKKGENNFLEQEFPGFLFVPLVSKQ